LKVLDLFAGIGGFTLGLERAGFETAAFCEIDPYAQKVLRKNWPGVPIYDDVRDITAERLVSDGIRVDVITGGFPCQDISLAGRQSGIDGERSGLWSECARLLGELRPKYAIFENVTNLLNGERGDWFKRVLWDISEVGYDAEWHCIPASAIGAHHHRDRVWILAYPSGGERPAGTEEQGALRAVLEDGAVCDNASGRGASHASVLADTCIQRLQRGETPRNHGENRPQSRDQLVTRLGGVQGSKWEIEPDVGRVADGVPARSHRLKCLGNAVVPAIPRILGEQLMQREMLQMSQN
jgi:DNA (cytosine-5)-methyltransferase 1